MAEAKEKLIKPRDMKTVTIKANKFYKEDTEVEIHSELAAKLLAAGRAYEGKPKPAAKEEPKQEPADDTKVTTTKNAVKDSK